MWLLSLRKVFSRPQRHTSAGPRRRQVRPTLQLLEDRVVQSVVVGEGLIRPPAAFAVFPNVGPGTPRADAGMGMSLAGGLSHQPSPCNVTTGLATR
jgi:hypothetical protein